MNIQINGVDAPIVLRTEKNAELTFDELDGNFQNLALKTMENDVSIGELESGLQSVTASIPDVSTITTRVADLEEMLSSTNLVVGGNGIVYDPNDVANKKPYFDTPIISLWNEKGQYNDTMLTVTSSSTVDADNQDYHITVSAVERDSGAEFILDDKVVIDLSKYYDEFIQARRVHLNGTLVFDEGQIPYNSTKGVAHLGALTFLVYFAENDNVAKIVPTSMMQFDDLNIRTKEIFVLKEPTLEISVNIDSKLKFNHEVDENFTVATQGNEYGGNTFNTLFGTDSESTEFPFTVRENSIGYHITFADEELEGIDYGKYLSVYNYLDICSDTGGTFQNTSNADTYGIMYSWKTATATEVEYYSRNGWLHTEEL